MLPSDGRFGSGPAKIRPAAFASLASVAPSYLGTSHRRASVRDVIGRVRTGLATLFALPDGYEIVLGNGGTTAFFDLATFCLIESRSQHCSFGDFSARFATAVAATPHLADPEILLAEAGTPSCADRQRRRRHLRPDPQRDLDRRRDARDPPPPR